MKLYYSPASPYVRKVRVLALETGLMENIELAAVSLTPIGPDANLCGDNPIGKIPTLVRDDGSALYDSRVICEYLDAQHSGKRMFPRQRRRAVERRAPSGTGRWNSRCGGGYALRDLFTPGGVSMAGLDKCPVDEGPAQPRCD